ncbi:TonB family protein [Myxococcota bacterium]
MAMSTLTAVVALATAPVATWDDSVDAVSGAAVPVPETESAVEQLIGPIVMTSTDVQLPEGAIRLLEAPVTVVVKIQLDDVGQVEWVKLERGVGPPFDQAVMEAATHFVFEPATFQGDPVQVEIEFAQMFAPPQEPMQPRDALLSGRIVEKGTRRAVPTARLAATVQGEVLEIAADANGGFNLPLPHGDAVVEIYSHEHKPFRVHETVAAGQQLEVRYLIERLSYNPYEAVVIGKRERHVVSRTSLRNREIKQVPGTFGDPFRVVDTLPGVGHVISLLAYPIVRGTSPGATGFLLDGVRVPQLFHMLAGPAVVHPELIERVDFYPGSFPVEYGGYIGGVVDGITHRTRLEERILDAHVDFTKAGVFVRGPVEPLGVTGTIAGRYGYPGLMLDLLSGEVYARYWDYQAQVDGGSAGRRWRAFVFGSFDEAGELDDSGEVKSNVGAQFHRVDLTYYVGRGELVDTYKLVLGLDQTLAEGEVLTTLAAEPRARWSLDLGDRVLLRAGIQATARKFIGQLTDEDTELQLESEMFGGGAFLSLAWEPSDRLRVIPGVRTDVYHNTEATQAAADPRLMWRFRIRELEHGDLWLKGGLGLFHQPPRFLVPIPGFEEIALDRGLLASAQVSVGIEAPLRADFTLDAQAYFQHMDPILFDLTYSSDWQNPEEMDDSGLFEERVGRSYGLEVLIKHHGRGALFGWLSYTLSWSDREMAGEWVPFDFDRRHMLHLVAGVSLPRNWDVAVRLQLQSGRPVPSAEGFNRGRTDPFYRVDIRIDKRAVWNEWLLDFYIDIINTTLSPERLEATPSSGLRYTLPTLGVRIVI